MSLIKKRNRGAVGFTITPYPLFGWLRSVVSTEVELEGTWLVDCVQQLPQERLALLDAAYATSVGGLFGNVRLSRVCVQIFMVVLLHRNIPE